MTTADGQLRRIAVCLLVLVAAACAPAAPITPTESPSASPGAPAGAGPAGDVPAPLAIPPGHRLVLAASVARGSQIYACSRGGWSLFAPAAVLNASSTDLLHTAGPRWIATGDGSAVTATPVSTVPVPGAAPDLLLRATAHDGGGVLAAVDLVQRLAVRGGATPEGSCREGDRRAVGYTAEYRFYAPTS